MVVLDDDPTGIQTVQGCLLITQWDDDTVRTAFQDTVPFFYILTNTRAMTRSEAEKVTREAMEAVVRVNCDFGYRLIIVSRSDSCLRGHFPLEPDVMRQVLVNHGFSVAAKTPFCPALIEAGRVTIDGVHYMKDDAGNLIPVSETEFARDNVFAYHSSVLREYIEEKGANPDDYEIVNAQDYEELDAFADRCHDIMTADDPPAAMVIRSSSSLPKAIADTLCSTTSIPADVKPSGSGVGVFIVGSHVMKTTRQLQRLLATEGTKGVEVDVQQILDSPEHLMRQTLDTILNIARARLTPVVYTTRKELRIDDANQRQHLGQKVSSFLVDIVRKLPISPAYLVAKGGITSHDILTRGLGIKSARVMGQIVKSVPCVMAHGFPYVIFPGNVGTDDSLREVYLKLTEKKV
ncbi:MAG: hypothetical protein IJT98_04870 [Prevotella sp.]|nr:hypothetical protein [Prevotella sp.]